MKQEHSESWNLRQVSCNSNHNITWARSVSESNHFLPVAYRTHPIFFISKFINFLGYPANTQTYNWWVKCTLLGGGNNWRVLWKNRISSISMKLRKSLVKPLMRQNISSCLVLSPEIVMHDAFNVILWTSADICVVVHDDLGWKNRTTGYILPRHWLYEWFSQFPRCGTYSVLSRSHSIDQWNSTIEKMHKFTKYALHHYAISHHTIGEHKVQSSPKLCQ